MKKKKNQKLNNLITYYIRSLHLIIIDITRYNNQE